MRSSVPQFEQFRQRLIVAFAFCALTVGNVWAGDKRVSMGGMWEDNLNNAPSSVQSLQDSAWRMQVSTQQPWRFSPQSGALLSLGFEAVRWQDWQALSFVSTDIRAAFWRSLGLGYYSPSLRFSVATSVREYQSDGRDGEHLKLQLSLGQRLNSRWSYRFTVLGQRRVSEAAVFTGESAGVSFSLFWRSAERGRLQLSHLYLDGDQNSSVVPPHAVLVGAANLIVPDDALSGFNAYRLDMRVHQSQVSWLWPVSSNWRLKLNAVHRQAKSDSSLSYRANRVGLQLQRQL